MPINEYDDILAQMDGKKAERNEYDSIFEEMDSQPVEKIKGAAFSARDIQPARAQESINLSKKMKAPVGFIGANYDQLMKEREDFDHEALANNAPAVASWMSKDPNNYAAAKNDVKNLSYLERQMKHISQQFEMGQATMELSDIGEAAFFGRVTPEQRARQKELELKMQTQQDYGINSEGFVGFLESTPGYMANQVPIYGKLFTGKAEMATKGALVGAGTALALGQAGPQVATPEEIVTVPAGAITGATLGWRYGAGLEAAKLEASLAYLDYEQIKDDKGVPLDRGSAMAAAMLVGAVNGSLEAFSFGVITTKMPGLRGLSREGVKKAFKNPTFRAALARYSKEVGESMATEGMTEFMQEMVTSTGKELLDMHQNGELEKASATDIMERVFSEENLAQAKEAAKAGAGAGGGMTATTSTMTVTADIQKARKAKQMEQAFSQMGEVTPNIEIIQKIPEESQALVQEMVKDGPVDTVYVPVEQWQEYFQKKGVDPEQAAIEVLGEENIDAYNEAIENGSDIAIPMSNYATKIAPSPHHEFFQREIKADPMDWNAREADEFIEQMDAQDASKEEVQAENEEQDIHDNVVQQLVATGMNQDEAETNAQLLASGFATLAERSGISPQEFYGRYGLEIGTDETAAEGQQYNQQDVIYDEDTGYYRVETDEVKASGDFMSEDGGLEDFINPGGVYENDVDLSQFDDIERPFNIEHIEVNPELRGKGFGKDAMLSLEAKAVEAGADAIFLNASPMGVSDKSLALQDLIGFYESIGYEVIRKSEGNAEMYKRVGGQSYKQENRGRIRISPDRKFNIDLFKDANRSTFLHESGHLFLELMGDLAEAEGATQQITDDYQAVLDWFGVQSRDQIEVKHHEMWARGFEAYLMEGKAPNSKLRIAFAKFSAWLTNLYRNLKNLNVELTPDVREVMDRMLATDEEIEAASQEQELGPLFVDLTYMGMNDQQAAEYSEAIIEAKEAAKQDLMKKHIKEMQREKKRVWKEEATQVREEVEAQIDTERNYIALANLQRGTLPNGDPLPEGMKPIKLDRKTLIKEYDANFVKFRLPRPYIYSKEGGVHPDIAAQLFGYESGDQMLQELANAKPRKEEIKARVEQIMKERHGDLLNDGSVKIEAEKAIHNDKTAQLMRKELEYLVSEDFAKFKNLQKRISKPIPKIDIIRKQSEERIRAKRVRDIRPIVYKRAESKFSRLAQELLLKGDFRGAFDAKMKQLVNHEMYRAAVKAQEQVGKTVRYMKKFEKKSTRQRLGKAGGTFLEQIDDIMDRFSFRSGVSLKSLDKKQSLLAWMQEQQAEGFTVDLPEKLLNESRRTHYKEMPFNDLVEVADSVKNIEHLARVKNKLLASKDKREMQEIEDEIVASIGANHKFNDDPPDFAPSIKKNFFDKAKGVLASHTKMEFLFEYLDGYKANGAVWQYLFKPFADAEDAENTMMRDISEKVREIFGAYTTAERSAWYYKREFIPEINNSMNKINMLAVALNWGNEYNRTSLMEGYGWNEAQVQAILNRLDERDWQTVQKVWDYIDTFWPAAEALEKELNGVAPPKVEATEVDTKYGKFKGGYYPIVFDSKLSWRQKKIEEEANIKELFGGNWAKAMTRHGHLKARTNSGGKPIKLNLSSLTQHLSFVAHDLTHRKAVIDVQRIVNRPAVRAAIRASVGTKMYEQINPWIQSIAGEHRFEPGNNLEGFLAQARMGATAVNMGWKFTTAIVQFTGYSVSTKELGAEYAMKGLQKTLIDPFKIRESYRFISERSAMMRDRLGNYDRDIRDSLKKLQVSGVTPGAITEMANKYGMDKTALATSLTSAYGAEVRDTYFTLIGYMDLGVSMPTWMGAYEKAMDGKVENIEKGNEKDAAAYADRTVRVTQGAGSPKDLASVQRGTQAWKLFTMFYSYFSVLYNQFQKTGQEVVLDKNIPKFVGSMFLLWFLPAVVEDLILGRGPDEDADDEEKQKWLAKKILTYPFQSVVLLRDVVNGMDDYGYSPSAAFDAFESLSQTGKTAVKFATGEKDEIERKDIKSVFMTGGYLTGLPSRQIWLSGEYFYDWSTGEVEPENPAQGLWEALVTGRPKD